MAMDRGYTLPMPDNPLEPVRPLFHALTEAFIPEATSCTAAEWDEADQIVARMLADRPAAIQRQITLFIRILNFLSLVRYGRGLVRLDQTRRTRLLESVAGAPVLLLRRGVWGLRTLAMAGYYSRPETQQALGYRATAAGWEARR